MKTQLIPDPHHWTERSQPWNWVLAGGRAQVLPALPVARWLVVTEGRAWVTRTHEALDGADLAEAADGARAGGDHWLTVGDRLWLAPGTQWVAEAWPRARLALLQQPQSLSAGRGAPASAGPAGSSPRGRALASWWQRLYARWIAPWSLSPCCPPRPV